MNNPCVHDTIKVRTTSCLRYVAVLTSPSTILVCMIRSRCVQRVVYGETLNKDNPTDAISVLRAIYIHVTLVCMERPRCVQQVVYGLLPLFYHHRQPLCAWYDQNAYKLRTACCRYSITTNNSCVHDMIKVRTESCCRSIITTVTAHSWWAHTAGEHHRHHTQLVSTHCHRTQLVSTIVTAHIWWAPSSPYTAGEHTHLVSTIVTAHIWWALSSPHTSGEHHRHHTHLVSTIVTAHHGAPMLQLLSFRLVRALEDLGNLNYIHPCEQQKLFLLWGLWANADSYTLDWCSSWRTLADLKYNGGVRWWSTMVKYDGGVRWSSTMVEYDGGEQWSKEWLFYSLWNYSYLS